MKFKALQDNLRNILWSRIEEGNLTGLRLARETGFKQAHISNFLNKKRGLSVEGMDKVLKVQNLSVLDLIDPDEIDQRASIAPPSEDEFENVRLVSSSVAATQPRIMSMQVRRTLKFRKAFLRKLRPAMEGPRDKWERFVLTKVDARDGHSMSPRLPPGTTILLDRHYNSLKPYRNNESNMYAVIKSGDCILRYAELAGDQLVLRAHNPACPVEVVPLKGKNATDYLAGRICHIAMET